MTAFVSDPSIRIVRGACPHDCPDTCAMLVKVKDGRAISVVGDPAHPITQGFLCAKVSRYVERTYHEGRVLHPLRRVGPKGSQQWERIGWDEALATIAERFHAIIAEWGPQAILPYSYSGTLGLLNNHSLGHRFFHTLGASMLDRTICATAGMEGYAATIGKSIGTAPEHFADAKLIIIWGSNTLTSNPHLWPFIKRARAAGAKVLAIDPYRSRTAAQCDEHLAINVGTDAALALGMMHVIFRDGLQDQAYLDDYTVGAAALCERASEYPPERVAEITGLSAARITALAHEYATTQPAVIRINYGLQRHAGGGMAVRTLACLPAVVGAWRQPAGGILLSTSGTFGVDWQALERPDLVPSGTRTINMSLLGQALTEVNDPPVKALFVYNSNPAAVAPDLQAVQRGLERDDLFVVVHEQFMTDTCDYADIVLPATTQLEHHDLHKAYGHTFMLWNEAAIAPLGEALPNTEVFRRLARQMGLNEPCLYDSDDEIARQALGSGQPSMAGITLERLKEHGWMRINHATPFAPFAQGGFPTPSGKCELWSERLANAGHDPLPTFIPPRESAQSNPELAARYPLALLSPPAHHFLNTTFANVLQRFEGEPTLEISAEDAARRGVASGDRVRIWNDRGAFEVKALVSDRVKAGVVVTPSIWWRKLAGDRRNVNMTTSQALTDLGAGATFYDNLVEVQKA